MNDRIKNPLHMARPKTGRKTYPHSIALTLEQIEFLSKAPNASKLLRSLLDDLIKNQSELENKMPILSLKHQVDQLEEQKDKIWKERSEYATKHDKEIYQDGIVDQPLTTPEANYHRKILDSYNDAILDLNTRIRKMKEQIIFTSEE